jgi:Protein of unknown function (DUF1236)
VKNLLRCGTIALAFASGIGLAAGQVGSPGAGREPQSGALSQPSQIKLSPAQKTAILNAVRQDGAKVTAPTNFQASVGGPVPPSIELYTLPSGAVSQSPELRSLKYTIAQNQVVLVDPTTMRVIDIIRQ